jgi:hypothetical protein
LICVYLNLNDLAGAVTPCYPDLVSRQRLVFRMKYRYRPVKHRMRERERGGIEGERGEREIGREREREREKERGGEREREREREGEREGERGRERERERERERAET